MYDPSGDTLSLFSLESQASAAPSVYTKYSKGSKWSHAKPEPLSTDVTPTTVDQSSNTPTVETRNQATQYETQGQTQDLGGSVEQDLPFPFHSASIPQVPHPPQSSSITTLAPVSSVHLGGNSSSLEAARVTYQSSTSSTTVAITVANRQLDVSPSLQRVTNQPSPSAVGVTAAAANQLNMMQSLQQDVGQGVAQQPVSTITQASYSRDQRRDDQIASQVQTIAEQPSTAATHPSTISAAPHDIPSSLRSETENIRAQQPSSTVAQPIIAAIHTDEESISHESAQPPPNHTQAQIQYLQQHDSDLVQSTEVQQPAYMSVILNDQQGTNQPSSTVTQASIQAVLPADDNPSLTAARQPDSSHLLQSTEVQHPGDMSSSLNDHQSGYQPSSTIPFLSLEDAQQPHDDIGSI